jgi:predicted ATPase/DNA-binding SARP family transcriptional activator
MKELEVSLLGTFEARLAGSKLKGFRTRKVQALFIYLLLNNLDRSDGRVDRERLMVLLWPEKPDKSARENLRQALYQLRQTVSEVSGIDGDAVALVCSDRQQVWINPQARFHLDVAMFSSLLQEDDVDSLAEAVSLYRGDFLSDFYLEDSAEFEEWAATWRASLRRQVKEALDGLAAVYLERGEPERAERYARRQLEIDYLHEAAHRHLMIALDRQGQRAEAIRQYERCCTLLQEELGVAPTADTNAIVQSIRESESVPDVTVAEARARLPVPPTPLIGRDVEAAEVSSILQGDARLVSIVGPGGIGKTRLALEIAQRLPSEVAPRVMFVNLTPLSSPEEIAPAVARALGIESEQDDAESVRRRLLEYLRDKRILLLLDNFEHLLPGARLLDDTFRAAPTVKLLVTSREVLGLYAEHPYPLSGLAYSQWETPVEAARDPAVQLFLHHAKRVRPAFRLRGEHLAPLRRIMQLTEGMPLALILAAGWTKVLSPGEIAAELERSLDFLHSTHREVLPRQRSIRAVFDSTWARLDEPEQRVMAGLSVFRGGFTVESAREVVGAAPHDLLRLADRSLIVREEGGRFAIHELVRQFAAEMLDESGEGRAVRDAHSDFYVKMLAQNLPNLKGSAQLEVLRAIADEFENVRIAWRWACIHARQEHMVEASQSLYLFGLIRSRYWDVMDLFEAAGGQNSSSAGSDDCARPYALAGRVALLAQAGAREEAIKSCAELSPYTKSSIDSATKAYCGLARGFVLKKTEEHYVEAADMLREVRSYYESIADPFYAALTVKHEADSLFWTGYPHRAIELLRMKLPLARKAGDLFSVAQIVAALGAILWTYEEGPSERSERYYWEATQLRRRLGEKVTYAHALAEVVNMPLWREGDAAAAHPQLEEALAIAEEQNVAWVLYHIQTEINTHRLVAADYEEVLAVTEEVLASTSIHAGTRSWSNLQRGIALLALERTDDAIAHMTRGLAEMHALNWSVYLGPFLPFFGIIYARRGEYVRAVELLACGFARPNSSGRLEIDAMIKRFRAEMQDSLDHKAYACAWKRGTDLDPMEAAAAILEELAPDD